MNSLTPRFRAAEPRVPPLQQYVYTTFITAGYDAGTAMFRITRDGDGFKAEKVF